MTAKILCTKTTTEVSCPQIIFNEDGMVTFNRESRQQLPKFITCYLNSNSKKLYVNSSCCKKGFSTRKNQMFLPKLTQYMRQNKIHFPVTFYLRRSPVTPGLWIGSLNESSNFYQENMIFEEHDLKKELTDLEYHVFKKIMDGYLPNEIRKKLHLSRTDYIQIETKIRSLYFFNA